MANASAIDSSIRQYLRFLEDPDQLVDWTLVEELQSRVDAATDPLDRLRALAEFERARHPVEDEYRRAFVLNAKAWAAENRVPGSAFESLGVPENVLIEAGLASERESYPAPTGSTQGKRVVSTADLQAIATTFDSEFSAADLVRAAGGGSPMTVRKALNEMVESGKLIRLGSAPDWHATGRAPILYRRS